MNDLISKVKTLQGINKLSDRQLALRLGVDHSLWSRVKRELKPPGMKLLSALIREFPELRLSVYEFLANNKGRAK